METRIKYIKKNNSWYYAVQAKKWIFWTTLKLCSTWLDVENFFNEKKPKYPTTYAECCEVLVGRKPKPNEISFDKMELCLVDLDNTQSIDFQNPYLPQFNSLFRLRMCRDAYWKIAGEEMGLGKPWKPDWDNLSTNHEFIEINKGCFTYSSRVLVFPSTEMRDAFYNNFKNLIEECKELL